MKPSPTHDATEYGQQQYNRGKDSGISDDAQQSGWLVLIRHGESQWNALGKWTGHTDIRLSGNGRSQARRMGELIKDIELHHSFTSDHMRTIETLAHVLDGAGIDHITRTQSADIKERDYGDYTGMDKWQVLDEVGEETFNNIRRSWDHPIPHGETLEMVAKRAVPYYQQQILPRLLSGQNVVVVSSGNALRALIKYIETIGDNDVAEVEMPLGQVVLYHVTADGRQVDKQVRTIEIGETKA